MANGYVSEQKAAQIGRLIDEGVLSLRAIARESGVGRDTVRRIASGRRSRCATPQPTAESLEAFASDCGTHACGRCVYCRAIEYRIQTGSLS